MNSISKIFFGLISLFIFIWLIFSTFLSQNYSIFDSVYYKDNEKWIYWLEIKDNKLVFNTWTVKDWLKINYINQFDKILSYSWNVLYNEKNDSSKNILLKNWIFLINISEINSIYNIAWDGFTIKTNWPTTIFIDNSWLRTTVFSLNSNIEIKLINIENNKAVNTIYLFPHNYIKFIPSQNKNVENADLLRLTQRFPLEYFNEKILIDWEINKNLLSKIIWNKDEIDNKNISDLFLFLYLNNKNEEKKLSEFKTSKFGILVWEKLIKQYNNLFLNEAKKTIYYKNLILRTIWDIINSDKIDDSKNEFLITSLNELKSISEKDYIEMKAILDFYSNMVIDWWKNDINSKINFSKIYNKLENKKYSFKEEYILNLNNLYFNYDYKWYSNIYKDLNELNEKIISSKLDESKKSYFIFFLNKTIISWFEDLNKNKDIILEDILNIFDDYINTSIDYYSIKDNVRIRTWIEAYNEILKKLALKIESTYFEEDKTDKWLLVLSKKNNISLEKIKILEKNINSIFDYYEKNKSALWDRTKDELTKKEFEELKIIYNQYISAIKDYNSYMANYSEENKELLFWETINEEDNWNRELTIENALNYLKKFNYIETSYSKIWIRWYNYCENPIEKYDIEETEDPYCYKIENLIIWSNLYLNLLLAPNNYNTISNFSINWDNKINRGSYKLDNEKNIWDKNLIEKSAEKDIEKYKFENFFLYVFNPPNDWNIINIPTVEEEEEEEKIEETEIVKAFKRNKLLWENWDFKVLNWFIDIKYEDTIVKEIWKGYDVYIKNSNFNYSDIETQFNWIFSSKYIFLPDHSFVNPEIVLYDDLWNSLLLWNEIIINWNFKISELKDKLKTFFENIDKIGNIINTLSNKAKTEKIDINYDINKNLFYLKTKDIKISTIWISIKSINYKWTEILTKPISIYDFENNLKLIK